MPCEKNASRHFGTAASTPPRGLACPAGDLWPRRTDMNVTVTRSAENTSKLLVFVSRPGTSLQLKASVMISATMDSCQSCINLTKSQHTFLRHKFPALLWLALRHSQPKPESLFRCLRPLALPKPDVKLLVEGLLLSEGRVERVPAVMKHDNASTWRPGTNISWK